MNWCVLKHEICSVSTFVVPVSVCTPYTHVAEMMRLCPVNFRECALSLETISTYT
jgi:hypothetical protein